MADDDTGEATISQDEHRKRLAAKTSRIRELEEQMEAMRAELDAAKPAVERLAKVEADLTAARAAAAEAARKAETSVALARAGITDADAADLVLYRYGRQPEEGRPALDAWLAEGAKADPLLASVWAAPAAAAAPPAPPGAPASPPPPPKGNPNAGTVATPPPAPPALSASAIAAMTPEQYTAHRAAIRQAAGLRPASPLGAKT